MINISMPCLEDSISVLVSIRQLLYLPSLLFQCSLNHGHRVQQSCLVLGWALSSFFFSENFCHSYSSLLTTVKCISIPGQTESTQVSRYKQHYLEGSVTDSMTTAKITVKKFSSKGPWHVQLWALESEFIIKNEIPSRGAARKSNQTIFGFI